MNAEFLDDTFIALNWRKSRRCTSDKCVEIALNVNTVRVRDSANPKGSLLAYGKSEWLSFIRGIREGCFDRR